VRTLALVVEYDGSGYSGFARQAEAPSIAAELETALATLLGHPVRLVAAGRTDAGVHATGQVVSLTTESDFRIERLPIAVSALVFAADNSVLSAHQFDRLKRELDDTYTGAANAGRPMLLEGGLDWKPMSLTPKDMDFLEAKHTAAREIALAFGVPPMLLGALRFTLAAVPDSSSHHLAAQVAAVRIQVAGQVSSDDLQQAGHRLGLLKLDAIQQQQLTAEVLRAALACVLASGTGGGTGGGRLLGCEFSERALRFGLERTYRAQAQLAPDRSRRIELVDQANNVRPRTWS